MITHIEIVFGELVELSSEMQRRLVSLVEEICEGYEQARPDRVMWASGIGDRPTDIWSDEPSFDHRVFQIDCCERERFEGERRKKGAPRAPEDAVERVAMAYWNAQADEFNQWDALDEEERMHQRIGASAAIAAISPSPREKALVEALREIRGAIESLPYSNKGLKLVPARAAVIAKIDRALIGEGE